MLSLPTFDLPTKSSAAFCIRHVLPRMTPPPLVGLFAQNPFFSTFSNNGDFILASGHGSSDELTGQWEVPLWKSGQYDTKQTEGKVIKLVSCDCGQQLVPDLVNYGKCKASMGYSEDLLWLASESYRYHFWDDPNSQTIMKPIMDGVCSLLDGATAQESLDVEKSGYLKNMENAGSELEFYLLKWNYDHAVIYGDKNSRVASTPKVSFPFPPPPMLF